MTTLPILPPADNCTNAGMHFTILKKSPPVISGNHHPTPILSQEETHPQHAKVSFRPSALRLRRWSKPTVITAASPPQDEPVVDPESISDPIILNSPTAVDQANPAHPLTGALSDDEPPIPGSSSSTQRRKRASKIGRWNSEARERNSVKRAATIPSTAHDVPLTNSPEDLRIHPPLASEQDHPVYMGSKTSRDTETSDSHEQGQPDALRGRSPRSTSLPPTTVPTAYKKQRTLSPADSTLSLNSLLEKFGVAGLGGNTNTTCISGDSPQTHYILESQTIRRLGPLHRKITFSCLGGVDAAKLLVITRQELLKVAKVRGGSCLVDESWSYKIKGRRGVYKVVVTYSAIAAITYMDESPVASSSKEPVQMPPPSLIPDPQKPVALEVVVGVPGLMTIQATKD